MAGRLHLQSLLRCCHSQHQALRAGTILSHFHHTEIPPGRYPNRGMGDPMAHDHGNCPRAGVPADLKVLELER